MLRFLRTRLQQGIRALPDPAAPPPLPEGFRGRPLLDRSRCDSCAACAGRMPSGLLAVGPDGRPRLDLGAARFTPEEAEACPHGAVRFTRDHRMAARTREGLVSETGTLPAFESLEPRLRSLFGRSLRLRSVAAGSCNGCESELVVLNNAVFDFTRFGIQFVASPRHADGILLTGAVSTNMRQAVYDTWRAVPEPRLVIATGACAIDGGPFRGSPEVGDGVPDDIPVDLWVPGCPPHPLTLLDGLLRLVGRLETHGLGAAIHG